MSNGPMIFKRNVLSSTRESSRSIKLTCLNFWPSTWRTIWKKWSKLAKWPRPIETKYGIQWFWNSEIWKKTLSTTSLWPKNIRTNSLNNSKTETKKSHLRLVIKRVVSLKSSKNSHLKHKNRSIQTRSNRWSSKNSQNRKPAKWSPVPKLQIKKARHRKLRSRAGLENISLETFVRKYSLNH